MITAERAVGLIAELKNEADPRVGLVFSNTATSLFGLFLIICLFFFCFTYYFFLVPRCVTVCERCIVLHSLI